MTLDDDALATRRINEAFTRSRRGHMHVLLTGIDRRYMEMNFSEAYHVTNGYIENLYPDNPKDYKERGDANPLQTFLNDLERRHR